MLFDRELNSILWRSLFSGVMTEEEKTKFIRTHSMPDKGMGGIEVAEQDVDKAISILKEQVGEFEWDYYPEGFISSSYDNSFYYGKFEVEDLHGYLQKLIENEVTINTVNMFVFCD